MAFGRKIIVILGPTASGKSEMAVRLAKRFNGEIVSADSRQVYKGIDIGTGKILKKEMKGIPHHLLNIVSPKKIFTVVDYKELAEKAIKNILKKNKVPIICGGTGFYIQSITDNIIIPEVKPNWKLRKQLEKKPVEQLFKMLQKLDSERVKTIDSKNPRRLIRAIEIAKKLGKVPLQPKTDIGCTTDVRLRFLQVGIKLSEKELKSRIEKRVKKMINPPAGGGLIKETEKLKKSPSQGGQGLSWKRIYEFGFEYKYPAMFLQKKISKDEMLEKMLLENRHYAKRQMTWFSAKGGSASGGKKNKRIHWISNQKQAEKLVKKFL